MAKDWQRTENKHVAMRCNEHFDLITLGWECDNYLSSMAVPKEAKHAEKDPRDPERY